MNPLAWLNPGRWMLYLALAGAVVLGVHELDKWRQQIGHDRAVAEYAAQAKRVDTARAAVSAPIEAKHEAAVTQIQTVYKTIIKEVPIYVKADPVLGLNCPLSGGFRVLHDAAANGEVSDPARIPDAAPAPAQDVAETIVENYGTYREVAKRLTDLQAWVRAQQELKE